MTVGTERVDATDFYLRTTAVIFTAAVLVHGVDHVRRGLDASPTAVVMAGSIQAVVVLIAVVLVFQRTRWAPYAAMVVGFASAALFTYSHLLPGPGFLTDSFVSEPRTGVNWFSWVTAVLEISSAIVFGVVGARALRAAECSPRPSPRAATLAGPRGRVEER